MAPKLRGEKAAVKVQAYRSCLRFMMKFDSWLTFSWCYYLLLSFVFLGYTVCQIRFSEMLWCTLYRKLHPRRRIKCYAGLYGTNWDLNASHTHLREKRRTTSKNRWDVSQCLLVCKFNNLYLISCRQKIQKNHKHNPSILQQTKEDEEDENNVVNQTVSINTLIDYQYYKKKWYILMIYGIELVVSVVKHRVFMDSFQSMSWSAWKPSERIKLFCLPSTYSG